MKYGVVILPDAPWDEVWSRWSMAEEMGFDHAWTYDHLALGTFIGRPWFGAVPVLAAAALVTERIRLGTLVASPNYRHPVSFAKELATLDDIAGGRLIAGLGAGGRGPDSMMLTRRSLTPGERADRFAEFVELLDGLLRGPVQEFNGTYYSAFQVPAQPPGRQQPRLPFAIAASGPRGIRLAARYAQTWVTLGHPNGVALRFEQGLAWLRRRMELVERARTVEGRIGEAIQRLVLADVRLLGVVDSLTAFEEASGRFKELGFTDLVVHWPRPDDPFSGDFAVLERIAELIRGERSKTAFAE